MNYKKFYRELILTTTGSLPAAKDGMSEAEFDALCKIAVPQALKEYYLVAGRHSISTGYNIFLSPDKFERHDGFLWFMEENQAVCYWGIKENDLMQPIRKSGNCTPIHPVNSLTHIQRKELSASSSAVTSLL